MLIRASLSLTEFPLSKVSVCLCRIMKAETTQCIIFVFQCNSMISAYRFCISSHLFMLLTFNFLSSDLLMGCLVLDQSRKDVISCHVAVKTKRIYVLNPKGPVRQALTSHTSRIHVYEFMGSQEIILKAWCLYLPSNGRVYLTSLSVTKDVTLYKCAPAAHLRLIPQCIF